MAERYSSPVADRFGCWQIVLGAIQVLLGASTTLLTACSMTDGKVDGSSPTVIRLWRHETDDFEMFANRAAIQRFNEAQSRWRIDMEAIPQGSYTESITAAALAGQLPCVFDVDQPIVPNFAWTGHLKPLAELVDPKVLASINRGALGTYRDAVYSVGQFDVVLALFARRSMLKAMDIRIATLEHPYTAAEFTGILRTLKAAQPERFPFDINTKDVGEWITYAYSPWLQSGGADLIDRTNYIEVEGILNGDAAVKTMTWYQALFEEGFVEPRSVDVFGFLQLRSDFSYIGSWFAKRYADKFGEDLVIMPPIDFGNGPKVGSGSWQWGISRTCQHLEGAAAFIEFLLRPEEIAELSRKTGFVPVSDASAALTDAYKPGGQWRLFYEFAKRYAVPRPATPGYPKISSAFEKALLDIRNGKAVLEALDAAVDSIEYDIDRNRGYGFSRRASE